MKRGSPFPVLGALFLLGLSAVAAGQEPDKMTLLRVKAKMSQSYRLLPNFTCLQTIEQFKLRRGKKKDEEEETEKRLGRLRLEVGFINGRDSFAWPGGDPFEGKSLAEVVPAGAIGAGTFAAPTRSVFLSSAPTITFASEEDCGGRRCYRYDYEAGAEKSKYFVAVGRAGARVPYYGSFWVDAESPIPIRMEIVADDLPETFGIASATTALEYGLVSLNGKDFILPTRARVTMVDPKGNEIRNETVLSEYLPHPRPPGVQRAAAPDAPAPETATAERETLPEGLRLQLILQTAFDAEATSAGDPVTAIVGSNVKRGGSVIVPKGAVAHGRLVILQSPPGTDEYLAIGVEFDRLAFDGKEYTLTAHAENVDFAGGKGSNVKEVMGMVSAGGHRVPTFVNSAETMTEPRITGQAPGTAVFYVKKKELEKVKGVKIWYRTQPAPE